MHGFSQFILLEVRKIHRYHTVQYHVYVLTYAPYVIIL